jgi:hypothetical protein
MSTGEYWSTGPWATSHYFAFNGLSTDCTIMMGHTYLIMQLYLEKDSTAMEQASFPFDQHHVREMLRQLLNEASKSAAMIYQAGSLEYTKMQLWGMGQESTVCLYDVDFPSEPSTEPEVTIQDTPLVICHMDILPRNLIFGQKTNVWLVD